LRAFSGIVAIAVGLGTEFGSTVTIESADDELWAVEVGYSDAAGPAPTVRTVRPTAGLSPRFQAVEDLGSSLVRFRNQTSAVDASGPGGPLAPGAEAVETWVSDRRVAGRATRIEVNAAELTSVVVEVNGEPVAGSAVLLRDVAAIELEHLGQAVYCVGRRDLVVGLMLRTVALADLQGLG
jgi:hypothetical protein